MKPEQMSREEYAAHVKASEVETKKNAKYDENPRAAHHAVEDRVAELEARIDAIEKPKSKPAKKK